MVLVPSLTVIVPLSGIPRVRSDVLALSSTVPVPVAGVGEEAVEELGAVDELAELDAVDEPGEFEDVPLPDEESVLPDWDCCSALWIAAVSALLTRLSAV